MSGVPRARPGMGEAPCNHRLLAQAGEAGERLVIKVGAGSSSSVPLQSPLPVPVEAHHDAIICLHSCLHCWNFCDLREVLRLI